MLDVAIKTAILAVVVLLLTRRSSHDEAVGAHRLWMLVLVSPVLILGLNALLPPVAFVVPRAGLRGAAALGAASGWTSVLTAVYLVVTGVLLCRIAAGLLAVRGLVRRARSLSPEETARLRALAGDPRLVVREGDLRVPVTAGAMRPCVILPRDWRALPIPALTAILRHEAAHVHRRDCTLALAAGVIEAGFWLNPAVWLASARLRWFAEMACDAEAARSMGRGDYAAELLGLSAGWAGARSPRYTITAGAETSVARRIRLLIDGMGGGGRRRPLLPVALVVLLLATPLSAGLRFSASRAVPSMDGPFDHGVRHSLRHGH